MAFEHKEGYGAIFKETTKKNEKGPDYRGNVMVAGVVYELAGWIKTGGKGNFLSLKAQPAKATTEPAKGRFVDPKEDDRIPF